MRGRRILRRFTLHSFLRGFVIGMMVFRVGMS